MAEFVRAASTSEIAPGQARLVNVKGKEIVLFNVDGALEAGSATAMTATLWYSVRWSVPI